MQILSYYVPMGYMRYALTFFLGVLFLIAVGVSAGFLHLDFSTPGNPQLTASGALAYYSCYGEGECFWEDEYYKDAYSQSYWSEPYDGYDGAPGYWKDEYTSYDSYGTYYDYRSDDDFYDYGDFVRNGWVNDRSYNSYHDYDYRYGDHYEYDDFERDERIVVDQPWYVASFSGFGSMLQQIIPGAQQWGHSVQYAPAPSPPSIPSQPMKTVYPQPSCWVSAEPSLVRYGGTSFLQWDSFNAERVFFDDIGAVQAQGSRTVPSITSDRTFTLSVLGQGGSGRCYARVSVDRGNSVMPSCVISAHPSTISSGERASLAWVSSNAQSATLYGVGDVSFTGGMFVDPQANTAYTLTVRDSFGRYNTCSAQVAVSR